MSVVMLVYALLFYVATVVLLGGLAYRVQRYARTTR